MASARGPFLLYVLPLLSVLVLAVSLFLGTEGEAVRSAVVLGGPTDSEGPFRGRLQVVEEAQGAALPLANTQVLLRAEQTSNVVERRLVTDPTGWVEFELPLRARVPFEISVFDALGNTLARGRPILETARWRRAARVRPGELRIHENGTFRAKVSIERGVFAVPFEGRGALTVLEEGRPVSGAPVNLSVSGGRLLSNARGVTDREGTFVFVVAPEQHVSALRFAVFEAEQQWEFEQVLPVVPGAYGLSENQAGLVIQAPVPREEAWFTFVTERERLVGGRVDLREDARGIYSAKIPAASIPKARGLYVVLASSADGRSPSTVGYPLDGQTQTLDLWDGYLLDGGPAARSRAELRRRKVRLTLGAYAGLSGLLTLVLFVLRVRSADRLLQVQLRSVGATSETRDKSQVPLLIAVLGLFFAFSAGVLWIVAR